MVIQEHLHLSLPTPSIIHPMTHKRAKCTVHYGIGPSTPTCRGPRPIPSPVTYADTAQTLTENERKRKESAARHDSRDSRGEHKLPLEMLTAYVLWWCSGQQ